MQTSWINHFKNLRRTLVLAVVLALCAPALVTLLPTPALSAEQQLIADLGQSICSHSSSDEKNHGTPATGHECCVLCITTHHVFVSPNIEATGQLQFVTYKIYSIFPPSTQPNAPPDLRATAPRGPPSI